MLVLQKKSAQLVLSFLFFFILVYGLGKSKPHPRLIPFLVFHILPLLLVYQGTISYK